MTDGDRKIYLDLYDLARHNMRLSGLVMRFGKPLLLYQVKNVNDCFDPDDMEDLSCHDFLFACYMRLLGRLPEINLTSYPGPDDIVPKGCDSEFARRILPVFMTSLEYRNYHRIEDRPPPPPLPPPPPVALIVLVAGSMMMFEPATSLFCLFLSNAASVSLISWIRVCSPPLSAKYFVMIKYIYNGIKRTDI